MLLVCYVNAGTMTPLIDISGHADAGTHCREGGSFTRSPTFNFVLSPTASASYTTHIFASVFNAD